MTRLSKILARAESLAVPSSREEAELGSKAKVLLAKTKRAARRFPQTRGVILGGSFAKGTWLSGHVDLDIFVKFDPQTSGEEFERVGLEIGNVATRGYPRGKKYAQHPYTEATVDGVRVNIVPCFDVKPGEWKSAADRSPFHVRLVEKLPAESKKQVRLLKLFMHAIGVYGAEIQTRGFSGYAAEALVIEHGIFESVLRSFAGYAQVKEGRTFSLPDPIDGGRDLGIAVSGESLGRMVLASRDFLKRPDLAYFRRMSGKAHPSLKKEVVAVVFSHRRLSEDTLWGELRRTTRHIVRHLEVNGFVQARHMAASNNRDASAILLIPEVTRLPPSEQRLGPTVDRRKDVEAFISSNAEDSRLVWVDDDARVRLLRPREYQEVTDLLTDVVKGRVGPIGASREIEREMKRSARVLRGGQLAKAAAASKWLQDGIREITTDAVGTS
jgi:tRNA nucleotidyltransferase (CCA-adding enzyme)